MAKAALLTRHVPTSSHADDRPIHVKRTPDKRLQESQARTGRPQGVKMKKPNTDIDSDYQA
jgi:hypothetical protein